MKFLKKSLRIVLVCLLGIAVLSAGAVLISYAVYHGSLNRMDIYANPVREALPQTVVFGIVEKHFERGHGDGITPKALIIGYDGARADMPPLTAEDENSAIQALVNDGGALYHMYCGGDFPRWQKTSTSPGWTNLLTGRWARERDGSGHGVNDNGVVKAPDAPPLLFNALFDKALVGQAAFVVSWDEYWSFPRSIWYHDKNDADAKEHNIHWVNLAYDGDIVLFEAGLAEIQNPDNDFIMVTLDACDYAGHGGGFGGYNQGYADAFVNSERYAYDLIQAVKARPTYAQEDWLIIIASDHGGIYKWHGLQLIQTRQIFMAANRDFNL